MSSDASTASSTKPGKYVFLAAYLLHVSAAYVLFRVCIPWLVFLMTRLPFIRFGNWTQLFSAHLFLFSFLPALGAGAFLSIVPNSRLAQYVWIAPVIALAYEFIFHSATVYPTMPLESELGPAFSYWFGDATNSTVRTYYQIAYTASAYVGVGYSLGATVGIRLRRRPASGDEKARTSEASSLTPSNN